MKSTQKNEIHLERFVPYLLLRITTLLNLDMKETLRKLDLTIPRWRILAVLNLNDGLTISEISENTALEHVAASRVVVQMEREGLVIRETGASDNRYTHVYLTSKGQKTYNELHPKAIEQEKMALAGLSQKEIDALISTSKKILGNIEKQFNSRRR